jgi:hypothetical protein
MITARRLADTLLSRALELGANRPADDMAALVLAILPAAEADPNVITPQVRRLEMHIPI